jgi:hypothetical protein
VTSTISAGDRRRPSGRSQSVEGRSWPTDDCGSEPVLRTPVLSTWRFAAITLVILTLSAGCEPKDPAAETQPEAVPALPAVEDDGESSPQRAAVELLGTTAALGDDGIVRFNIQYRFTSGSPKKFYVVTIAFPGADRHGVKHMNAHELQTEGTITTGIEVGSAPVDEFEITMSEADDPQQAYFLISNTLTGNVARPGSSRPESGADENQ